ncbi:MAG: response regulator transcription factor [Melioribacteraceae bacterium]|nr:response regulator transcription factor [Melioribacteraceae bacterium]
MDQLLIIEDDPDVRECISEIFQENGYKVYSAPDGLTGINFAKDIIPDVIICDLIMPGIDGFEVKKILSNDKSTSSIPFIYLTGQKNIKDMRHAMELGADDYIIKPVKVRDLLNLVLKRLERIHTLKTAAKDKSPGSKSADAESKKFLIKSGDENLFISFNDLVLISADGYYSIVHLRSGKKITMKRTLKNWLTRLPEKSFIQVHRKMIINFDLIEKIEPGLKGTYIAKLKNYPEPVYFSQRCSQKIRKDLSLKSILKRSSIMQ